MEILIIIALLVGGIVLFAIEVFLIPGISLAGIASGISMLYAVFYAFTTLGTQAGVLTLAAAAAGIAGVTIWFMRSKTVDRLSLKQTLDYKPNPLDGICLKVGDKGTSITRLTLIGNAKINEKILEVQSSDGFIDEKTPIRVSRITDNTVYVERDN